ncbi:MAG: aminotransferase class V-fold PLP-dependent enzyme [Clostridiaceae bacterium]|nr:aminotransferase class V-fold PLP-dependent enzyme [Clostridiaceae bacterium]
MIYFDNAATTLQKPATVRRAVSAALYTCANPGRSAHAPAMRAADTVFACRRELADLFGLEDPGRVVFTCNATYALNIAIRSLLQDGGHAVISGYEHNSVVRPLEAMKSAGVTYTVARAAPFDAKGACTAFRDALREDTICIVCNHVSNVFGCIQPLMEIDSLCVDRGIPLIIDASQSAGVLPINVQDLKSVAFVCMPGHKSLFGPQGTGVLLCCNANKLYSVAQGGTGSLSRSLTQPDFLPDMLESGTLNVHGIAGLLAGVRYVRKEGIDAICQHERMLTARLADRLADIPGVTAWRGKNQTGVLSFTTEWADPDTLCHQLGKQGICLRCGLHCAPLAHESAGTLETGTVRASFSPFNTGVEVDAMAAAVRKLRH